MTTTSTDRINGQFGGAAIKTPCVVATTANITLSGTQTIDGVAVVADDRVVVKTQTSSVDNGIYVASASTWTRAKDFDSTKDVVNGSLVKVNSGSTNSGFWYVSATDPITVGTTAITFVQASAVLAAFSAFAQTLLGSANAAAFMTNLGFSAFGQTMVDDASATVSRATLGMALTTKGDLLVGTGSSAVTRKAVGSDGLSLMALSAATEGVAYVSTGIICNGYLAASVAASALTISLVTESGGTPSSTDPVLVKFRNATSGTGTPTTLTITAATTLVISSGSTLGTTSALPSRVWVVIFNDASTARLGAINCSNTTNLYPLADDMLASSTAEGGAGAADSAGIIYSGAAVTTKALRVLGYVESTQATAGTWATTPSKVQCWEPGMKLPGDVVQRGWSELTTRTGYVTTIPLDNTIPTSSEGTQILAVSVVPTSAINFLFTDTTVLCGADSGAGEHHSLTLFQDAGAAAIAAVATQTGAGTGSATTLTLTYRMRAGTVVSTTLKIRIGTASASGGVNSLGGTQLFGGVGTSRMDVLEVMA